MKSCDLFVLKIMHRVKVSSAPMSAVTSAGDYIPSFSSQYRGTEEDSWSVIENEPWRDFFNSNEQNEKGSNDLQQFHCA